MLGNKEPMALTLPTNHHFKDSKRGNSSDYEYHLVPDPLFFSRLYPHVYKILIQPFLCWILNQIFTKKPTIKHRKFIDSGLSTCSINIYFRIKLSDGSFHQNVYLNTATNHILLKSLPIKELSHFDGFFYSTSKITSKWWKSESSLKWDLSGFLNGGTILQQRYKDTLKRFAQKGRVFLPNDLFIHKS